MKILWLVLTLIPAPFLFHFYEYGQHIKGEDAPFLASGSVLLVITTGVLAGQMKIRSVILVNVVTIIFSLIVSIYFIPDDGWFKPVGRNGAVIFTGLIFLIGQMIVRAFSEPVFKKKRHLQS